MSTRALLQLLRAGDTGEPPAFTPASISGLRLWLDASDASTITDAGAGAVSQWDDKSANGYDVTQGTSGARPTTGTRTINSLNAIDFDGTEWLRGPSAQLVNSSSGTWTAFCVGVLDTAALAMFVDQDNFDSLSPARVRVAQMIRYFSGNYDAVAFNTAEGAFTDTGPAMSTGTAYLMRTVRGASTLEAFLDGASSGGSTATTGTPIASATPFTIGAYDNGNGGVTDGAIGEVVVYNRELTSGEIAQVEAYLAAKWGITL